ncbi:MAG: polyprenyl synthetase family protein [Lactobacillaceae bacterium]|jgi:heptaprenyl diphosphate synthase|nr:polyprenyl synthetase family protein [Lactobacillaceae bacterium]
MSSSIDFLKTSKEINENLKVVSEKIEKNIEIDDPSIYRVVRQSVTSGKMVRPTITLLINKMLNGEISDVSTTLAASVEVLHNATLIHDDIIDNSDLRRGSATLNARYSEDVAVYSGDLLFVSMYKLLNDAKNFEVNNMAVNALYQILNGELIQKRNRFDLDVTFDDYYSQIYGKTAALFELATSFGAIENREAFDQMKALGFEIGMAFQIMDDYLDYASDDKNLEKPLFQDLQRGIYTAPLLYTIDDNPSVKEMVKNQEFSSVASLVKNSSALQKTVELALTHTKNAESILNSIDVVDEDSRNVLIKLIEKLSHRGK